MDDYRLPEKRRIELAKKESIPVLSGLDVGQSLRGEMDEADEWVLRDLVIRICAAKQGMLSLYDDTPERLALMDQQDECPLAVKVVPIEEIVRKDTEELWLLDTLEALTQDHPVPFIIPPTEAVVAFLKERGEH
jgi:cephalosporin-C deacetylase-like acetyl esterase